MSNTYRALTDAAKAAYEDGVFERDFTATEEKDTLDSGLLELVPRRYKVLSNNYTGGEQGELIEAALLVEIEAALISGGHLERARKAPAEKEPDPKPAAKKADTPSAKKKASGDA
jgi:hypothetical protein